MAVQSAKFLCSVQKCSHIVGDANYRRLQLLSVNCNTTEADHNSEQVDEQFKQAKFI